VLRQKPKRRPATERYGVGILLGVLGWQFAKNVVQHVPIAGAVIKPVLGRLPPLHIHPL
jgi:hypothetical protein